MIAKLKPGSGVSFLEDWGGGSVGAFRLYSLQAYVKLDLDAASQYWRKQWNLSIQTRAVCGCKVTLKIKCHGEFKC